MTEPANTDLTGRRIGVYEITARIQAGGVGVVYEAIDTRLHRPVAIKFLLDPLPDAATRQRFRREAEAASSLNHPHILTVYDVGEFEGREYLVTEFVDGGTFRGWLDGSRPREGHQAVDLLIGVADGLAAAHRAGILHRDIKPENILLTNSGYAKLADFGLAKLSEHSTRAAEAPTEQGTRAGMIVGTLGYMSPEQALGKPLDARSDVFSFGTVLYEALAGQRPFTGPSDVAVMNAVVHHAPSPWPESVPVRLRVVVDKALEKDPADRFRTMDDMVVDLRRAARSTAERELTARPIRPALVPAIAAMILLVGMAAWLLVPWLAGKFGRDRTAAASKTDPKSIAVLPFTDLSPQRDQEYFCDGITDELITALSKVRGLQVVARTSAFAFKGKSQDIRMIGQQLNAGSILEGSIRKSGNRIRVTAQLVSAPDGFDLWSETYDRELTDVFSIQEEISRSIASALQINLFRDPAAAQTKPQTTSFEAYNLYLQGRHYWYYRTEAGLRNAAAYFERAIQLDPQYARAYAGLGDVYVQLDGWEFVRPHEAMPRAKEYVDKALSLDPTLAEAYVSRGAIFLTYDWDPKAAGRDYARAVELDPTYITGHWWYASWLGANGQRDEAQRHWESALKLDPLSVPVLVDASLVHYAASNKLDTAQTVLRKALDIDPTNSLAHRHEAIVLALLGKQPEADAALERAVALAPDYPAALADLAAARVRQGRTAEARQILERLQSMAATRYVPAFVMAIVYFALGDEPQTLKWLGAARDERSPRLGWFLIKDGHYHVFDYGSNLAPEFRVLVRQVLADSRK
jgi:serine/threonine protein kinase/Tfp pilus assembly protein PilF